MEKKNKCVLLKLDLMVSILTDDGGKICAVNAATLYTNKNTITRPTGRPRRTSVRTKGQTLGLMPGKGYRNDVFFR